MSPTSAGHPRCEVEGDPEELEEDEMFFEGKSRARIRLGFASDRKRRHRGASKKFDGLSGWESCRKIGRIVRENMEVFDEKSTATRGGEGGSLVQLIIHLEDLQF